MRRTPIVTLAILAVWSASCTKESRIAPSAREPAVAAPAPTARPVVTRSPGCPSTRTQPNGETFTTPSGRTFHVWGPKDYDRIHAYPVMLTYHGWYANGRSFENWFKMEDTVNAEGFTVYPDSKGPTWDLSGNVDLLFFDEMTQMLGDTFCIDPSRIFALGFSYGGKFMSHLGCNRAGLVKAVSVGDGSGGAPLVGCERLPVLFTHRTRDPDERIEWGRSAAASWIPINGCSNDTESVDKSLGCVRYKDCKAPGQLLFCEDTFFDPTWKPEWNHTVRDVYRAFAWKWFLSL